MTILAAILVILGILILQYQLLVYRNILRKVLKIQREQLEREQRKLRKRVATSVK